MQPRHTQSEPPECRYSVIGGDEACGLCTYPLLSRAFYVFPCQHGFHGDCLTTEVAKQMKPATKRRLDKLQAQVVLFFFF